MSKTIYHGTPYRFPLNDPSVPEGSVFLDSDKMRDWEIQQWKDELARQGFTPDFIFTPTFRLVFRTFLGSSPEPMDHTYYASMETAQYLANKYGTGEVVEVPPPNNWALTISGPEFHIRLKDGRTINAGLLAGLYERNPDDLYPGKADKAIREAIAKSI